MYIFLLIDSGTFSTSEQGNRLRLFELQSVSADAMRIVFDSMPRSFTNKIKKYCKSLRNFKKKNDLLSGIYAFFYFKNEQYLLQFRTSVLNHEYL